MTQQSKLPRAEQLLAMLKSMVESYDILIGEESPFPPFAKGAIIGAFVGTASEAKMLIAEIEQEGGAPQMLHDAAGEIAELRELIQHCSIHSGYQDCGFDQMTNEQKALYLAVTQKGIASAKNESGKENRIKKRTSQ